MTRGVLIVMFVLTVGAGSANANPASEQLFRDGRSLMKQAEKATKPEDKLPLYQEAADRFERSNQIDPSIITLLNLGDCLEQLGRTASAWETFLRAKSLSVEKGDASRGAEADRRAALVEPQLARLLVVVASAGAPQGLVIRRSIAEDGPLMRRGVAELGSATWNVALPLDPGTYTIEATAPGRLRWATKATVTAAKIATVIVEPLAVDPNTPRPEAPVVVEPWSQHALALGVLLGAGTRENTLIGARGVYDLLEVPHGKLRGVGSLHYTRYADQHAGDMIGMDRIATDLKTDSVELTVTLTYLYSVVPRLAVGGGIGIGVDFDFPLSVPPNNPPLNPPLDRSSDYGALFLLELEPAVIRVSPTFEASLHVQFVISGTELVANGVVAVDWFLR